MRTTLLAMTALTGLAVSQARADTVAGVTFGGPGVSGNIVLTYGATADSKYPGQGFEITGISGTFSDSNLGIVDAPITSLVGVSPTPPLDVPPNLLAPDDFSHFAVATGLPAESRGFITYDNLFWPHGAPPTASAFDGAGGFLDIYGLLFNIGGTAPAGTVVDLFNNGVSPTTGVNYGGFGVVVATSETALDSVGGGIAASAPEPSTWAMMILGFAGLGFAGYRASRRTAAIAG